MDPILPLFASGPMDPLPLDLRTGVDTHAGRMAEALDASHAALSQQVLDAAWASASALASCEAKITRAYETLRASVAAAHGGVASELELASYNLLAQVQELAASHGCKMDGLADHAATMVPAPAGFGPMPPVPPVTPHPPSGPTPLVSDLPTPLPTGSAPPLIFPGVGVPPPPPPPPIVIAPPIDVIPPPPPPPIPVVPPSSPAPTPPPAPVSPCPTFDWSTVPAPAGLTRVLATCSPTVPCAAPGAPVIPGTANDPTGPTVYACPPGTPKWLYGFSTSAMPPMLYASFGDRYDLVPNSCYSLVWQCSVPAGFVTSPPPIMSVNTVWTVAGPDPLLCGSGIGTTCPPPPPIPSILDCNRAPFPDEGVSPIDGKPLYCKRSGGTIPPITSPFTVPMMDDLTSCTAAQSMAASGITALIGQLVSGMSFDIKDPNLVMADWIQDAVANIPSAIARPLAIMMQPLEMVRRLFTGVIKGDPNCNATNAIPIAVINGLLGLAEKYLGSVASKPARKTERWLNWLCPDGIPSQGEADRMYSHRYINHDLWECWTKANNNIPATREMLLQAMRTKPNVHDLIKLYRREVIDDTEFQYEMERQGVTTQKYRDMFVSGAEFRPGPSDVMRFAARDVGDPKVIADYRLDEGLSEAYQGNVDAYARENGMDLDVITDFWRAHWRLPSVGQAYEMYRRLRPSKYGPGMAFGLDDLKKLLAKNEVAPGFVDRLAEIETPILDGMGLRMAYFTGAVDDAYVTEWAKDQGFADEEADIKLEVLRSKRWDWLKGRWWYKKWVSGHLTDVQGEGYATGDGADPAWIAQIRAAVYAAREAATTEACTKALKRRYMLGDLDPTATTNQLVALGHDLVFANEALKRWNCELSAKGKSIPANQLCDWASRGIITPAEYQSRLIAIGYTATDAARVVAVCSAKLALQQARAASAAQAAQQRQASKAASAQKQKAKSIAQGKAKVQATRTAYEKAEEKAQIRLLGLAGILARAVGIDDIAAVSYLKGVTNDIVKTHGYSIQGAVGQVAEIVKLVKAEAPADYVSFVKARVGLIGPPAGLNVFFGPTVV